LNRWKTTKPNGNCTEDVAALQQVSHIQREDGGDYPGAANFEAACMQIDMEMMQIREVYQEVFQLIKKITVNGPQAALVQCASFLLSLMLRFGQPH